MTKTVDQWAADACGAKVTKFDPENDQLEQYWEYKGKTYDGKWTIDFADCREIVREHYHLETIREGQYWIANVWSWGKLLGRGKGKIIEEAECNCITAIFEASQ